MTRIELDLQEIGFRYQGELDFSKTTLPFAPCTSEMSLLKLVSKGVCSVVIACENPWLLVQFDC
jgi:hypothetical protein